MKQYQKGEVILAMVVIMAIVWMSFGHMGMMGHGTGHAEKTAETAQQQKTESPQASHSQKSSEHQH